MRPLATERLLLREWDPKDLAGFARLNQDPRVMRYLPRSLSAGESAQTLERIRAHFHLHGFGLYAAELRVTGHWIGFIGLNVPSFEAHFTPCVEIGWRLQPEHWNQGLATEGAHAVLRHAFTDLALREVVAFTVPANRASRRVMEKLGMTRDPEGDFDHPNLPPDHPLRRHVLYRLSARAYAVEEHPIEL